jgi:O-antigen/teichoic acid export membrane protein
LTGRGDRIDISMLRNSLAHLVARVAALAAGIVTIPFVTLTLGTEALGLVGVYSTLLAMLGLFDLGLPMAANHRLAVLIGRNAAPAEQAVLVRTLEVLFWGMGALFLVVGFGSRSLLASSWLNASVIPQPTVDAALAAMIATVAVRFPVSFYTNILFARDRHVFPNAVTAASAVLRIAASAVALIGFDADIVDFFLIQLIGSVCEVALLTSGVWHNQIQWRVAPRLSVLRDIGAMTGGLTLVSLSAVVLSQIDKIVLSKMLSLGDFGLYSAGYTLAAGLVALSYPVGNAIFPRLSRAIDAKSADTTRIIRAATELTALIIIPIGSVLIVQCEPLLQLLFLVKPVPATLASILPLMIAGAIAQGFVTLPHLYQVAAHRVMTVVWINAGFLIPYGAGVLVATVNGGVQGAAAAFAAFNVARLLMHWTLLVAVPNTRSLWLFAIVMTLAMIAGGITLASALAMLGTSSARDVLVAMVSVPLLAVVGILAMPISRQRVFAFYRS